MGCRLMLRVGLIGYGYWGPNLFRNLRASSQCELVAVADLQPDRLAHAASQLPGLKTTTDANDLISDPTLDALFIATPASSHYALASAAIRAGKHVLIEKPVCTDPDEAADLAAQSRRAGVVVCADHVYLMSPIVQKIHNLVRDGTIGRISYIDCIRVNLGLFRPDVSVLWDLGTHDFSILDLLIDAEPLHVEATGHCHVKAGSPDVAFVTLHYPRNVIAHVNLSWMSPVKVRRLAIGGDKQMLVWDDLLADEPLKIYDSGIELRPEDLRDRELPEYRVGDILSPRVARTEALSLVVKEFFDLIRAPRESVIDATRAARVVRLLSRAQTAIDRSLREIEALRRQAQEPPAAGVRA